MLIISFLVKIRFDWIYSYLGNLNNTVDLPEKIRLGAGKVGSYDIFVVARQGGAKF